jgi:hypothetical protein
MNSAIIVEGQPARRVPPAANVYIVSPCFCRFAHDHYDLFEQRFDFGFARGEAETLEQTAHLVLDISQSAGLRFKSRRMPLAALDELFHQESEVGP